ncbi:MAG: hypothetical protein ACK4LB_11560 [Spirosomataceae bacterium]
MAKNSEKPRVHKDLDGFDIEINSFGEIQMSYDIDKLNSFLNEKVDDKKLRHLGKEGEETEEETETES